jgi:hypothetical protein
MQSTSVEKSPTGRLVIGNISEKVAAQIRESVMRALKGSHLNAVFLPNKNIPTEAITSEKIKSQKAKLLRHMKLGNSVSSITAMRMFGITCLHRRLKDLKDDGHIIKNEWVSHGGSKYKRYWMD